MAYMVTRLARNGIDGVTEMFDNLLPEVKDFFIKDYSQKAIALREKAANPKSRKAAFFIKCAAELEDIVQQLKAA